jgi:hypothetical protein
MTPKEKADQSWEGCDGCTEQDEAMYKNGYIKGYNATNIEISDEEISEAPIFFTVPGGYDVDDYSTGYETGWEEGVKWYREQLKQKK